MFGHATNRDMGQSAQENSDFQPQLYGRGIAKVGCNATLGRIKVVNKIVSELTKLQGGRFSEGHLRHRCSLATRAVLGLVVASVSLAEIAETRTRDELFRLVRWK
jgi:hypothetical protein